MQRQTEVGSTVSSQTAVQPYREDYLVRPGAVSHALYFAEYGNPKGAPVLLIHGTALPFTENQLEFLRDTEARVIVFHQRGVGRSGPGGETRENSIPHTLSDIEALRVHLGVQNWSVFGWSLGSTIATAYAQANSERVTSLLLSGVFLASAEEYQSVLAKDLSANPEKWKKLSTSTQVPLETNGLPEIVRSLYKKFCDPYATTRHTAMRAWLQKAPDAPITAQEENYLRVNFHYRAHGYFVDSPQLQRRIQELSNMPTMIVSGSRDVHVQSQSAERWANAHGSARVITVDDDHFFRGAEAQKLFASAVKNLS